MTTNSLKEADSAKKEPNVEAGDSQTHLKVAVDWVKEHRKRLVKFGLVGALGVLVNWVFFEVGVAVAAGVSERFSYGFGVTLGIVVSIFANFVLNDIWTWGDRSKRGGLVGWVKRMTKYYIGASVAAGVQFVVFWISLEALWRPLGWVFPGGTVPVLSVELPSFPLAPRLSLLTGIAAGMALNFLAGHLWAFRDADE